MSVVVYKLLLAFKGIFSVNVLTRKETRDCKRAAVAPLLLSYLRIMSVSILM